MINSVQNVKSIGQNPFTELNGKMDYYITPKVAEDIFEASEKNNEKKSKKVGLIIAGSAILTTLGIFALTKGLPKNTYKWLKKLGQRLEENVNKRRANGERGPVTAFYNYALKKTGQFIDKSKSINNLSTFKDLLLIKALSKNKFSNKIAAKITALFERLARRSVHKGYKTADKNFSKLFNTYSMTNANLKSDLGRLVTINNITKPVSEWLEELSSRQAKIKTGFETGFGRTALQNRYSKMKKAVSGLEDKVWDTTFGKIEDLKNPKIYTTFIAEDLLAADKIALTKNVNLLRRGITHDILDNYRASKQLVDDISSFIEPNDKISAELLKTLKYKLTTYKKLSGQSEVELREKVNTEIVSVLKSLSTRLKKSSELFKYDKNTVNQAASYIDEIEKILSKSSKGEFQEILTIYKGLLPKEQYVKLRAKTNSAIKSFDKAINAENDLFFDKLRDLKLGSGPTDVLSVLGAMAGVGLGLTKADNKDERVSAALKYGIPVVGAVATSLMLAVSLVSGFKSMVLGTISGFLISDLGVRLDKYRKQYNKKQEDKKHAEAIKAEINSKAL